MPCKIKQPYTVILMLPDYVRSEQAYATDEVTPSWGRYFEHIPKTSQLLSDRT